MTYARGLICDYFGKRGPLGTILATCIIFESIPGHCLGLVGRVAKNLGFVQVFLADLLFVDPIPPPGPPSIGPQAIYHYPPGLYLFWKLRIICYSLGVYFLKICQTLLFSSFTLHCNPFLLPTSSCDRYAPLVFREYSWSVVLTHTT